MNTGDLIVTKYHSFCGFKITSRSAAVEIWTPALPLELLIYNWVTANSTPATIRDLSSIDLTCGKLKSGQGRLPPLIIMITNGGRSIPPALNFTTC